MDEPMVTKREHSHPYCVGLRVRVWGRIRRKLLKRILFILVEFRPRFQTDVLILRNRRMILYRITNIDLGIACSDPESGSNVERRSVSASRSQHNRTFIVPYSANVIFLLG